MVLPEDTRGDLVPRGSLLRDAVRLPVPPTCAASDPHVQPQVARHMRMPWPLVGSVVLAFPQGVRDAAYDLVAAHRYRLFGRTARCQVRNNSGRASSLHQVLMMGRSSHLHYAGADAHSLMHTGVPALCFFCFFFFDTTWCSLFLGGAPHLLTGARPQGPGPVP